eukprot:TRINITY_DN5496_c0_g1_i1.p1 TRINITY_DN5496_c0_g1~~TRINITY_DN5496_c0_g1_i1.p1  ORF type:complete len:154 (+),score=20.68 TRINITY_DN5496_c0_g1_i1:35-463(+)
MLRWCARATASIPARWQQRGCSSKAPGADVIISASASSAAAATALTGSVNPGNYNRWQRTPGPVYFDKKSLPAPNSPYKLPKHYDERFIVIKKALYRAAARGSRRSHHSAKNRSRKVNFRRVSKADWRRLRNIFQRGGIKQR